MNWSIDASRLPTWGWFIVCFIAGIHVGWLMSVMWRNFRDHGRPW